jgi:hypothetical protein
MLFIVKPCRKLLFPTGTPGLIDLWAGWALKNHAWLATNRAGGCGWRPPPFCWASRVHTSVTRAYNGKPPSAGATERQHGFVMSAMPIAPLLLSCYKDLSQAGLDLMPATLVRTSGLVVVVYVDAWARDHGHRVGGPGRWGCIGASMRATSRRWCPSIHVDGKGSGSDWSLCCCGFGGGNSVVKIRRPSVDNLTPSVGWIGPLASQMKRWVRIQTKLFALVPVTMMSSYDCHHPMGASLCVSLPWLGSTWKP